MPDTIAIVGFEGGLPAALLDAHPGGYAIGFEGFDLGFDPAATFELERLGEMFEALRRQGVKRIVLAGSLARPALNPTRLDATTMALAPRLMTAMQGGDDAVLRFVIEMFEAEGFTVIGAHEVAPELVATAGLIAGVDPGDGCDADIARAAEILNALAPVDVGQACVVAGGICHGIETIQGTDALLRWVAQKPLGGQGTLLKTPKLGQELRVDMPTIGPQTLRNAAAAGISCIAVAAGQTLILERAALQDIAHELGLSIIGVPA